MCICRLSTEWPVYSPVAVRSEFRSKLSKSLALFLLCSCIICSVWRHVLMSWSVFRPAHKWVNSAVCSQDIQTVYGSLRKEVRGNVYCIASVILCKVGYISNIITTRQSPGSTFEDWLWWLCIWSRRASVMVQTTCNSPVIWHSAEFQEPTESSLFRWTISFSFPFISSVAALTWTPCYGAKEINTLLLLF